MLSCTGKRSHRHTILHVSFSNSFGLASAQPTPQGLSGAPNNALDVLSGQAAGVNVTSNGLDRMAMLNSVRVRGTTSIIGGNDPLVLIDGVTSDVLTLSTIYVLLIGQ